MHCYNCDFSFVVCWLTIGYGLCNLRYNHDIEYGHLGITGNIIMLGCSIVTIFRIPGWSIIWLWLERLILCTWLTRLGSLACPSPGLGCAKLKDSCDGSMWMVVLHCIGSTVLVPQNIFGRSCLNFWFSRLRPQWYTSSIIYYTTSVKDFLSVARLDLLQGTLSLKYGKHMHICYCNLQVSQMLSNTCS